MTLERDSLLKDRYRILEILGQGGMGAVYHAKDESLGVEVAVKENLFTSDEYSRQFQREATILATMRHPNLPRVIDHFEIEEQGQYMVMDYIEGEDLRQRMDRLGSLKDEEVIIIGAAICDALEYLHTRKPIVLHRDLKPGNIKVNPEGNVYLVDFGLAKIVSGNQVTTTGARAMTPGYSSPEQYGTARTDERSDIYSLGATLYAALTNTIPEDGLARAMEQADLTPIRKRNPKISRRVASAVEKALAVHPEDRYQTVGEFKVALLQASNVTKQIQQSEEMTIPPPPPEVIAEITAGKRINAKGANEPVISGVSGTRKRRKLWRRIRGWIYGLVVVLALAFSWIWFDLPGNKYLTSAIPPAWVEIISPEQPTATSIPTTNPTPTASPTATEEVLLLPTITLTPTNTPIPPTPTITPTPTEIPVPGVPTATPHPPDYDEPFEREQIAFASIRSGSSQIWLYTFPDGELEQLTDLPYGACQPSWSPDGRLLAFISPCARNQRVYTDAFIFVLDMVSSDITQLAVDEGSFDPAWSPDGSSILPDGSSILFANAEDSRNASIYRITTSDAKVELMTGSDRLTINPEWDPKGEHFAFSSNRTGLYFIYIMENDITAVPQVFVRTEGRVSVKPTWSINGTVVYSQGSLDSFLSLWSMKESMLGATDYIYREDRVNLDSTIVPELDPDFNSSGNWIAYESWPDGVNRDIYIMREDGAVVMRITTDAKDDFDPTWRPFPLP
jgi:serine/threonine protein kinase/Tol biopolymer transport system component